MLATIPGIFPIITTRRLTLRQPSLTDAAQLFLLRSDPHVNKYLDRKPAGNIEEVQSFIQKVNNNFINKEGIYWAITETGNNKLIGSICLFDCSAEQSKCEIGYELLPIYQGRGIMKEALDKIMEWIVDKLKLHTIDAFTHKDNQSSTALLQKANFIKTSLTDQAHPDLFVFRFEKK